MTSEDEVEAILASCERSLASGLVPDLRAERFWSAVGAAKRNASLATRYGTRIASIDRAVFGSWALFAMPVGAGTWIMVAATATAGAVATLALTARDPWNGVLLLAGTAGLLVTTHGLAHLAVGAAGGMRFTHWFIGSVGRPQPGVKLDYASYLRADPLWRAWMHASGAIVSKLVPFAMAGVGTAIGAPLWATLTLIAVGAVSIVTDALWSVQVSDWKKFRRELRYHTA